MSEIILKLRARHFKNVVYMSNDDCPVARAAKEHFKTKNIGEGVTYLYVVKRGMKRYNHKEYNNRHFAYDKGKAKRAKSHNKIIREVVLTEAV